MYTNENFENHIFAFFRDFLLPIIYLTIDGDAERGVGKQFFISFLDFENVKKLFH